jgi:hypothetical protein
MPRRLSQKDQDFAIERLIANRGDVSLTANELGISRPTLYRLRKLRIDSQFSLSSLSSDGSQPASTPINSNSLLLHTEGLPSNDLQALRELKTKMLDLADYIITNDQIKAAIDEAPLNQRIAALIQLTDRIAKLAFQLPAPKEEQVIRIAGDPEEIYDPNFGYAARTASESDGSLSG